MQGFLLNGFNDDLARQKSDPFSFSFFNLPLRGLGVSWVSSLKVAPQVGVSRTINNNNEIFKRS